MKAHFFSTPEHAAQLTQLLSADELSCATHDVLEALFRVTVRDPDMNDIQEFVDAQSAVAEAFARSPHRAVIADAAVQILEQAPDTEETLFQALTAATLLELSPDDRRLQRRHDEVVACMNSKRPQLAHLSKYAERLLVNLDIEPGHPSFELLESASVAALLARVEAEVRANPVWNDWPEALAKGGDAVKEWIDRAVAGSFPKFAEDEKEDANGSSIESNLIPF